MGTSSYTHELQKLGVEIGRIWNKLEIKLPSNETRFFENANDANHGFCPGDSGVNWYYLSTP